MARVENPVPDQIPDRNQITLWCDRSPIKSQIDVSGIPPESRESVRIEAWRAYNKAYLLDQIIYRMPVKENDPIPRQRYIGVLTTRRIDFSALPPDRIESARFDAMTQDRNELAKQLSFKTREVDSYKEQLRKLFKAIFPFGVIHASFKKLGVVVQNSSINLRNLPLPRWFEAYSDVISQIQQGLLERIKTLSDYLVRDELIITLFEELSLEQEIEEKNNE